MRPLPVLPLSAAALLFTSVTARPQPLLDRVSWRLKHGHRSISQRQGSTCVSYGIDIQDGGSYFLNSNSNASFTCVSQFSGCQDGSASVLLVDDQTGDEYECSDIPTTPDDTSQISTCPLQQEQMSSGNWSLLIIGNNGDADPFAYERDFYLDVAPQQTITYTPTATYYQTITPTATTTTTSWIEYTTSVPATYTVTSPATTAFVTVTPAEVTTTQTDVITRTVKRWAKTQQVITAYVTPSCSVPPKQQFPDPTCTITPTLVPLPSGLTIQGKRDASPTDIPIDRRDLVKRNVDQPTVTTTAQTAVNTTLTITGTTSTVSDLEFSTAYYTTTLPPQTVRYGTETDTVTAPTPTDTLHTASYTVVYITTTMTASWTFVSTVAPSATVSACISAGGSLNTA